MRKKGGGIGSSLASLVFTFVILGILLAFLQFFGVTTIDESVRLAKEKAVKYSKCIPAGECGLAVIIDDIPEIFKSMTKSSPSGSTVSNSSPSNNSGSSNSGSSNSGGGEVNYGDIDTSPIKNNIPAMGGEKGYRGPEKGEPFVNNSGMVFREQAYEKLQKLTVVPDKEDSAKKVGYSRKEWKHWIAIDGRSCWNTRSEILHRDAVPGTVKYINKSKQTSDYSEACAIGAIQNNKDGSYDIVTANSGEWIDPYSGKKIKDPKEIDIDHIIPLSNAARQGGQEWPPELKEAFANDPDNLLATSAKENRKKGEKGPGKYMPPLKSYHCQYAKSYVTLSDKYKLSITESDYEVLNETIKKCTK